MQAAAPFPRCAGARGSVRSGGALAAAAAAFRLNLRLRPRRCLHCVQAAPDEVEPGYLSSPPKRRGGSSGSSGSRRRGAAGGGQQQGGAGSGPSKQQQPLKQQQQQQQQMVAPGYLTEPRGSGGGSSRGGSSRGGSAGLTPSAEAGTPLAPEAAAAAGSGFPRAHPAGSSSSSKVEEAVGQTPLSLQMEQGAAGSVESAGGASDAEEEEEWEWEEEEEWAVEEEEENEGEYDQQGQLQLLDGPPGRLAVSGRGAAADAAAAAAIARAGALSESGQRLALAAARQLGPAPPRKFVGLINDKGRPWQKQVLTHLCCNLPPPACHIYCEMEPTRMSRVLAARTSAERRLRDLREDARWQLARANGWLDRALSGEYISPNELTAGDKDARALRAATGELAAVFRDLAEKARAYSDHDYLDHMESLGDTLDGIADLALDLRRVLIPYVRSVLAAEARARRRGGAAAAFEAAGAQAALARCRAPPELLLPPPPASPWRYPPGRYVLRKRKGLRGGWSAPLAMPGMPRPLPRVREGREDLPAGPGGAVADSGSGEESPVRSSGSGGRKSSSRTPQRRVSAVRPARGQPPRDAAGGFTGMFD